MKRRRLDADRAQFRLGDLYPRWIPPLVQASADTETGLRRRRPDQLNNHFVADQRLPAPVLSNVAEHAMLDLVPLAGPWGEVAHMDGHPEAHSQLLQCHLPQAAPAAVAATAVGGDQ